MKRSIQVFAPCLLLLSISLATPKSRAQAPPPLISKVSAIQVLMIQSDEIKLPAEFQISLYENLIQQLEKKGGFQHVYRDGDKNAAGAADLVVLHSTVRGFKKGSEMARQVTSVTGKTSIDVHCQFSDKDGKSLLEHDLNGKVMFFGGNLRATFDLAKKAAKVAHDNFVLKSGPKPVRQAAEVDRCAGNLSGKATNQELIGNSIDFGSFSLTLSRISPYLRGD